MPSLWKLGARAPLRLLRRVKQRMGENELSTRAAALSYYFVLALFPLMLIRRARSRLHSTRRCAATGIMEKHIPSPACLTSPPTALATAPQ